MDQPTNCIVSKPGIFAHDYAYNVCTNTFTQIPWTAADWVAFVFGLSVLVAVTIGAGAFVWALLTGRL